MDKSKFSTFKQLGHMLMIYSKRTACCSAELECRGHSAFSILCKANSDGLAISPNSRWEVESKDLLLNSLYNEYPNRQEEQV